VSFKKIKHPYYHHPFMIPIAKPVAILPVNGMPRFVSVGKSDAAAWLPPTPPEAVLLDIVFVTVDRTP
jgi:hypothetical protein